MKSLNQLLIGLLASLLSIALVLGSLSISFAEAGIPLAQVGRQAGSLASPSQPPASLQPASLAAARPSLTPLPSEAPTSVETAANCPPPSGWVLYTVRPKDNLYRLSLAVGSTVAGLQSANCLGAATQINAGQQLYLPRLPQLQPTPIKTRPPTTEPPATQPHETQAPAAETQPTSPG